MAAISTKQYGGPGTAGLITTVSLTRTRGDKSQVRILQLEQPNLTLASALKSVSLKWVDQSNLSLTYRGGDVDFQAIRCGDVNIKTEAIDTEGHPSP